MTQNDLEARLKTIDQQLEKLAHFTIRTGMGAIGFRSNDYNEADNTEWIEIQLKERAKIDLIALVPSIWNKPNDGYTTNGFPACFRVIAGSEKEPKGQVVATFNEDDKLLPRVAPLIIKCDIEASWIRIEATKLSPQSYDDQYVLQLAEILAFSGNKNIALNAKVKVSSSKNADLVRKKEFVVDGFTPYLMHSGKGERSIAYLYKHDDDTPVELSIDLGKSSTLDRIHLHSIDLTDNLPQSRPDGFAIPKQLLIQGADKSNFENPVELAQLSFHSALDTGPMIIRNLKPIPCRYVKLTITEPYVLDLMDPNMKRSGFAEVELLSQGVNIALNKPFVSNKKTPESRNRSLLALTDGKNVFGAILPFRQWIEELSMRHLLEAERPLVFAELEQRYSKQKNNLNLLRWLAALLASGILFTVLISRIASMRRIAAIKKRVAADLHDELGANIHTIAMLNDLSRDSIDENEREMLDKKISNITRNTGAAIRQFSQRLESENLYLELLTDMERTADRITTNMEHEFIADSGQHIKKLKPRIRADLFLFYKESLVNICRHAEATKIKTEISSSSKSILLTIDDNGIGLPFYDKESIPNSLIRRAKLLKGNLNVAASPLGGTRIILSLQLSRVRVGIKP